MSDAAEPKTNDAEGESIPPDASPETAHRWRKRRKAALILLAVCVVTGGIALIVVLWFDYWMGEWGRKRIYDSVESTPPHEVALVLGASVRRSGKLSAMLQDRVMTAVELYRAGKVKKLLMSGDNSRDGYNESSAMRKAALSAGVDPDDVVRDFAGFRTYDSVYRARDLWGVRSMVIVTQRFHLPRALYIAERLGVDAVGTAADTQTYTLRSTWKARIREAFARAVAWIDLNVLETRPHFLGARESLSGREQDRKVR